MVEEEEEKRVLWGDDGGGGERESGDWWHSGWGLKVGLGWWEGCAADFEM